MLQTQEIFLARKSRKVILYLIFFTRVKILIKLYVFIQLEIDLQYIAVYQESLIGLQSSCDTDDPNRWKIFRKVWKSIALFYVDLDTDEHVTYAHCMHKAGKQSY